MLWIDQLVIKETNNQYLERLYIIAQSIKYIILGSMTLLL